MFAFSAQLREKELDIEKLKLETQKSIQEMKMTVELAKIERDVILAKLNAGNRVPMQRAYTWPGRN